MFIKAPSKSLTVSSPAHTSAFACHCAPPFRIRPRSRPMRRNACLLLGLWLGGCATAPATHPAPPAPRSEAAGEDRDAAAAVLVGSTFQSMQRLSQVPPAEQAEILAAARASFERTPQGSV